MLQIVARLSDGKPFIQIATSISDALTILRAMEELIGNDGSVWIEHDGIREDADQFRRDHVMHNLSSAPTIH